MKIKLVTNHWHAGVEHMAGETIEVDEAAYKYITETVVKNRQQVVAEREEILADPKKTIGLLKKVA